ncbi:MAG: methanogenesis marker 17 protein [Methanosarcinaceae archaeon]|nr:methanogenesis marker 17 protein [Methanosarcinaceae archaeon]
MEPLETFVVESKIKSEAEQYKKIVSDAISDLVLSRAIGRIKVVIRPEDTLFQMAMVLRGSQPPVKTVDFAHVRIGTYGKSGVQIDIINEHYLPQLLDKLWAKYGPGNVSQPERKTVIVICENPHDEIVAIEQMVVDDPQRTLNSRLVDMAIRITPEGFRVRHHLLEGNHFIFLATEDIMKQEWIEETHRMLEELCGGKISGSSA